MASIVSVLTSQPCVEWGKMGFWSRISPMGKKKCMHTQLCLTLCDPMDYSPPGSPICGIFQAGILEWVAIPFSRGFSQGSNLGLLHCRQILYHWATRKTWHVDGVGVNYYNSVWDWTCAIRIKSFVGVSPCSNLPLLVSCSTFRVLCWNLRCMPKSLSLGQL